MTAPPGARRDSSLPAGHGPGNCPAGVPLPENQGERGGHVDQSPAELLTGRAHAHWLELPGLPHPLPS
jgi:hypothetical protein